MIFIFAFLSQGISNRLIINLTGFQIKGWVDLGVYLARKADMVNSWAHQIVPQGTTRTDP